MTKLPSIEVGLSEEALEVLCATRITMCNAFDCKNNLLNSDPRSQRVGCSLKHVFITHGGCCEQFTAKEATE